MEKNQRFQPYAPLKKNKNRQRRVKDKEEINKKKIQFLRNSYILDNCHLKYLDCFEEAGYSR